MTTTPLSHFPRIFLGRGPDAGPNGDAMGNPRSRAFKELQRPWLVAHGRSRDTIRQYELSVRQWSEYWRVVVVKCGTAHPALAKLRAHHFESFREWLVGRGLSNRTANKRVGDLLAILERCNAAGRDEFRCDSPPRVGRLDETKAAPKLYFRFRTKTEVRRRETGRHTFEDLVGAGDELSALYLACRRAEWPTRDRAGQPIDPVRQWRAAIVLYLTYGFRTGELIQVLSTDRPALDWSQITWDLRSPAPGSHAESPHGWLWYVPGKQQRVKPDPLCLPLSGVAAEHLRDHRCSAGHPVSGPLAGPVFHWPLCADSFYRTWKRIVEPFPVKRDLRTGKAIERQVKHLRKTATSWHNHFSPGIAKHILGHAARGEDRISVDHYDNAELSIVEAIRRLPVPTCWRTDLERTEQTA